MLMHSSVAIPSRDVAIHPTLAHTDISHRDLCQLDYLHPFRATLAFVRLWVSCRQTRGSLICCHRPYAPLVCSPSLAARFMLPSTSLSSGIQVYLLSAPPSARSTPNRTPYLAQGLSDLRGPACCIITYIVHGSAVAAASVACISSSWDLITREL